MWSKISNALKPRHDPQSSQSEVMSGVLEQHPNLSVFHANEDVPFPSATPPGSPTKAGRKFTFKRIVKPPGGLDHDDGSIRAASPLPIGQPKKVKSSNSNGSQLSLPRTSNASMRALSPEGRRSSQDLLRPLNQQGSIRSFKDVLRRPSIDALRPQAPTISEHSQEPVQLDDSNIPLLSQAVDGKTGSVRSILRDPNTPGTGRNVRFFSRDAYKASSADQSADSDSPHLFNANPSSNPNAFMEKLQRSSPLANSPPAMPNTPSSSPRNNKPTLAQVFSPLQELTNDMSTDLVCQSNTLDQNMSLDMSQDLDLPSIPPPGLGFDFDMSALDSSGNQGTTSHTPMSSTPFRDSKGKGKEVISLNDDDDAPLPPVPEPHTPDEAQFHAKEKSPSLPVALHDRSNSFSAGQTMFYSVDDGRSKRSSGTSSIAPTPSLISKRSSISKKSVDSPLSTSSLKNRSRALSDTVFHSMMRSSKVSNPESDINDESSGDLVVYSHEAAADPFNPNAKTYYGPQTMIPVTPPRVLGQTTAKTHVRHTSKEENAIVSLQTQLALQTELVSQYETDLRARDELVDLMSRRLSDIEKEEAKRKGILRAWKKRVGELEKACRYLEEEVEGSRHESMERSIMDEASSEALRMLHRQIASLENERKEWHYREDALRDEVGTLEELVKDRTDSLQHLQEKLWSREETERELKSGILAVNQEMELLGNVSIGGIDEEEVRRLLAEREQKTEIEAQRHRMAEAEWEMQRDEYIVSTENLKAEKAGLQGQVEGLQHQLKDMEEEYGVLKSELESQWKYSESASEKMEMLENERRELEKDRETLKRRVEELEERITNMELEQTESENRFSELEQELQEAYTTNDTMNRERDEVDEQIQQDQETIEEMERKIREQDASLDDLHKKHQFALEQIERLQSNLEGREGDADEFSKRVKEREEEAETLREEINNMKREHSRALNEQQRAIAEMSERESELKTEMEMALTRKTEVDVEVTTSRDRINALSEEMERLRRQIHALQQESADKDLKVVHLEKERIRDKDDMQGLNIALDSKQQELELIKRKLGARGTAASTPLPASKTPAIHRRDSSIFSTPGLIRTSRPSSVISDSGLSDTPSNTESKVPALAKSTRANVAVSAPKSRINGSMGPPLSKPRVSSAGTPTPKAVPRLASLAKSVSARPNSTNVTPLRRVPSTGSDQSQAKTTKGSARSLMSPPPASVSEKDEKENLTESKLDKRRSMIPTPA